MGKFAKFLAISAPFLALTLAVSDAMAVSSGGALVEEIDAGASGVSAFDTLKAGQTVDLRPNRHAVISYLDTCIRETITGGLVKVGTSQSDVQDGTVSRETVACSVKSLALTETTQDQSATTVFRPLFDNLVKQTLPDISPFILTGESGSLEVKEMGKEAAPLTLTLKSGRIDLREAGVKLLPGAIYKLTAGAKETYIKIAPEATGSDSTLLTRLVKL